MRGTLFDPPFRPVPSLPPFRPLAGEAPVGAYPGLSRSRLRRSLVRPYPFCGLSLARAIAGLTISHFLPLQDFLESRPRSTFVWEG